VTKPEEIEMHVV